ncbi:MULTISPECIES: DUF4241 domain-containing protein [Streptomyces]|uniref:DUF4241 domain-containing protein n=1 Tax=Streptomyces TaxID=1883 RepID=UPI0007816428|nr:MULTISPECIES: DUF4241 domain-containing protein [Streptomyces]KYK13179.1 hypothetical protein AUW26_33295 [Streptomyces sp. CC71]MDV6291149.1 DUF4241 domain-containing protein [Streptomyces sp. UP1A-1]RSS63061.1 DUF4241 domain-containing protein [Streptomyces sp. WAC06273]
MQDASKAANASPEKSALLEAVFTMGKRLGVHCHDALRSVDVAEVNVVASIRLPSGRLVVDTPWPEDRPGRELAERLPPGTYNVEASWVEAPYEFMGESFDGRECAAVRLPVRDEPVAVWEMALGVDDDIEQLISGHEIGFQTDTAMGAFADACSWQALTEPFRQFWERCEQLPGVAFDRETEDVRSGEFEKVTHHASQADLLAFPANEGVTAVWIGRTAASQVATITVAPYLSWLA